MLSQGADSKFKFRRDKSALNDFSLHLAHLSLEVYHEKESLYSCFSLLAILFLTACGNNKKSTNTSSSEVPKTSSSQKAEQKSKVVEFSTTATDTVLYEIKGLTATYKGLEKDDYEYTLKLAYKNTSNKEYEVQTRNGKVNNISNSDDHKIIICSDTLKASAASEGSIKLPINALEAASITKPKVLECNLEVIYDITETIAKVPIKGTFE